MSPLIHVETEVDAPKPPKTIDVSGWLMRGIKNWINRNLRIVIPVVGLGGSLGGYLLYKKVKKK